MLLFELDDYRERLIKSHDNITQRINLLTQDDFIQYSNSFTELQLKLGKYLMDLKEFLFNELPDFTYNIDQAFNSINTSFKNFLRVFSYTKDFSTSNNRENFILSLKAYIAFIELVGETFLELTENNLILNKMNEFFSEVKGLGKTIWNLN